MPDLTILYVSSLRRCFWADTGRRGGERGGGRGEEEAGCRRTGGCRSRNGVFSFQLLGRAVIVGGGSLFWFQGGVKCDRSRQWGTRSPVCRCRRRCPPLQHRHGAGEHRGQHGAAESSGRWGWRWRGWRLLSAAGGWCAKSQQIHLVFCLLSVD